MKIPKIEKLPSGTYYCRLRLDGRSISVLADTEAECRKQAELKKAMYAAGKKVSSASRKTVGELLDEYTNDRENLLSPASINLYRSVRRLYFQPAMSRRPADVNWQKLVNDESRRLSPASVNSAMRIIKAALRSANIDVPDVRLPSQKKANGAYLNAEQVKILFQAVRGLPIEIAVLLGLHSLRASEIFGLQWRDFDPHGRTVTVCRTIVKGQNGYVEKDGTKTKESARTIAIFIPRLYDLLLQSQGAPQEHIVSGSRHSMFLAINRVCRQCGLPEVGFHGLRRSFASLAYAVGLPERIAMQIGGWRTPEVMHAHYIMLSNEQIQSAENKLNRFFTD